MSKHHNINETIERASLVSGTIGYGDPLTPSGKYQNGKTPVQDIEGGALTAGGAVSLWSKDYIGLLANYAAVGIVYGAFPRTIYPFLNNYLNMDGYQTVAALTLVTMPWSFKTFIGIVSDSFPIFGYRRRPYIVIGWFMCFVMLLIMAILPVDEPFYLFPALDRGISDDTTIPDDRLNRDAPNQGAKYILLMMFASLFYVIADVCCDGMVVELAMREPTTMRGTTQTTIYLARTVLTIFSGALVGFCMNSKFYGGSFDWSLQFNEVMGIISVGALLPIPFTLLYLKEKKVGRESFTGRCGEMWKICQQRVIWQIMAYKFFSGVFGNFGAAPASIVQREWAGVEPLNDTIFSSVGNVCFAITLYVMKVYGLNWDWRRTIGYTTVVIIIIDAVLSFMTIFDVYRNQWFWLGVPILEEFPYAIRFIISTYICVEIADEGYEAATYGLITTVSNLSQPFSSTMYKIVDSYFAAFKDDIKRDDDEARWQVAYTFIIMYVMKALSLVFLIWLPRQKAEAQELKRTGGSNAKIGAFTMIFALFALVFSVTTNLLSIFESTACYQIAGGAGCT